MLFNLYDKKRIIRFFRIAKSFGLKNDGPFKIENEHISIYYDQNIKIGALEFKQYDDDKYYISMILEPICDAFDKVYYDKFIEYVTFLLWLDQMWLVTESVLCPICHSEVIINDDMKLIMEHISDQHDGVKVKNLKNEGWDICLETNIGDFILDNKKS